MYTERPVVPRGGQIPNMYNTTAQSVGLGATAKLIILENRKFKHEWYVTGCTYLDGAPAIVLEPAQLNGQKGRRPRESVPIMLRMPGSKGFAKGGHVLYIKTR